MVQAERLAAVGQTIATLSHHIKNILQGIRGGSYLIEEGLQERRRRRRPHAAGGIVEKNQEQDLHPGDGHAHVQQGTRARACAGDLNEVVADVVELMQARAAEADVELVWQPRRRLAAVDLRPRAACTGRSRTW